jgi:cell division transport system permease protein
MFLFLKRIVDSGVKNFGRQLGLNLATTFVMAITIALMTTFFYVDAISKEIFSNLQKQIGITAYFEQAAPSESILALKDKVKKIPGVQDVEYISREEAFKQFSEKYSQDKAVSKTIEIVGENPFPASFRVKAESLKSYEEVDSFLKNDDMQGLVAEVSYPRTEQMIKKIFSIASDVKGIGAALAIFLAIIVFVIVSSTVHLAVHNLREEIGIMKMMGASNWFVKGPYVVQGIICGLVAAVISVTFFGIVSYFLSPNVAVLVGGSFDLFAFYRNNFALILFFDVIAAVLMGGLFNYAAVRQYLKV